MPDISRRSTIVAITTAVGVAVGFATVAKPLNSDTQTADGLTAYIGVIPAEIVKGYPAGHPERAMHGGPPKGRHEYHIVAPIFDTASGARISDATVTAQVSGLGLSGSQITLEPMGLADASTFGAFVNLPGADLYAIKLTIRRPGSKSPAVMSFRYDHRS